MAGNLGTLTLDLVAKIGGFTGPLDKVDRRVDQSSKNIKKFSDDSALNLNLLKKSFVGLLGGLSVAGLSAIVKTSINAVAEIDKLATMAGTSAVAFQELTYAAGQYQITQDALTDGLKELALRGDEFAVTGAGSAKESFERLGYSAKEVNALLSDTPAFLTDIISRMEKLDEASQIRIADELFGGQGGEQFVKMIQGGASAMDDMRKAAHDLGVVIDDDMVKQSVEAKKQVEQLTTVISSQFNSAVAEIAPDIIEVTTRTLEWVKANKDLINQNVSGAITNIKDSVFGLISIYNSLPKDITGPAAFGIVGAVLFGGSAGKIIGMIALIDSQMSKLNMGLGDLVEKHYASGDAIIKLWDSIKSSVSGTTDAVDDFKMKSSHGAGFGVSLISDLPQTLLSDKPSSSTRSVTPFVDDKAAKKTAAEALKTSNDIESAYRAAYSSLDTMTQATYEAMAAQYQKDYDEFVKLTGEKETAQAIYAQNMSELNKKLLGTDENAEAIKKQIEALQDQANTYGMTAAQADLYQLANKGATDGQLAQVSALYATISAMEKQQELEAEGVQLKDSLRTEIEQLSYEFAHLKEMLDASAISAETYNRAMSATADVSLGLDNVSIPENDFGGQIDAENDLYEKRLGLLEQFRQESAELNASWDQKAEKLKQQHEDKIASIERSRLDLMLSSSSQMFGSMADITAAYAGEQSGAYKTMFAMSKSFTTAQATLNMWDAIGDVGATGVTWADKVAAMAEVAAQMGTIVSSIASVGMAHDGMDYIPKTGTWLLEKGERVTTEQTSRRLDRVLDNVQASITTGGNQPGMNVNIYESAGATARVEQSADGMNYNVIIQDIEKEVLRRMDRGAGLSAYFDRRYGRKW